MPQGNFHPGKPAIVEIRTRAEEIAPLGHRSLTSHKVHHFVLRPAPIVGRIAIAFAQKRAVPTIVGLDVSDVRIRRDAPHVSGCIRMNGSFAA